MESISFCRRKFDAIPFCREMQRRYLAVPKINPKSSDAECSAAPKKRFQGNMEPLLFLSFPEISRRDSNSPSGRLASRPGRTVLRTVRKGAGESLPAHQRRGSKETWNLFFFCRFRKSPEGTRTARPAALRPRHTKSSEPARFASHRRCFLSAIVPPLGTARGKKMPPARRNLEPAGLGALLFSIDGGQRGKRFASRRSTVYTVSSPAARSPLWAALSAVEGRSWSTLVSNWAR